MSEEERKIAYRNGMSFGEEQQLYWNKKDIKEILEEFESLFETSEAPEHIIEDFNKIKDYITNLQEYETIIEMEFKREYAKRYLEERRKEEPNLLYPDSDEIYKRYYELKEENERLTQGVTLLTNKLIDMTKAKENYKSRNEKAIEYINHEIFKRTILVGVGTKKYTRNILDNVLNILNGVDEE